MENVQRPQSRISYILPKLSHIWHYYPELSLAELLMNITFEANLVQSDLPITTLDDIEDIAYPEGHPFCVSRNLEMGILELENRHKGQPLPPTPIQTAYIQKVEKAWRKRPQLRLGQCYRIHITSISHSVPGVARCVPAIGSGTCSQNDPSFLFLTRRGHEPAWRAAEPIS
jgi:hypothetical protein